MSEKDVVKFVAGLKSFTSTMKDTDTGPIVETKIGLTGDGIGEDVAKRLLELQKAGPLQVTFAPVQRSLKA